MSTAVNKPTDPKVKEADINRKLQIYGIISAFQAGKVPSNEQIDVALNSFLASRALSNPSNRLSAEGRELVADVRAVVTEAKKLLLSKNEGNLLQDFIWQSTQFDPKAVGTPNAPITKDSAKQDGDKALEGLRTLGTLLITNGQFRKLLSDATILLRDMAGDAATNVASKVKPSDEALQRMDEPAADHTWHEKPDLSKDNIRAQAQGLYKNSQSGQDAQAAAQQSANAARNPDGTIDAQAGARTAINEAKNRIDPQTKESAKETAAQYRARTREYLGKKMPEERRDQTIWRLKKMVLECQQHPDYQQAVSTLLDLAEQYGQHGRHVTNSSAGTVKQARTGLQAAEADLRTLIERFANGTSSEDLWASIRAVYDAADRDPELKDWFKAIDTYVRKCLQQQGYIMEEESNREWDRLYDKGNFLLRNKYKGHTDRIVDEIKFLADQFDQDRQNKAFAAAVEKLFLDLGNDNQGKPTYKPHLVKDLTDVIVPAVLENIAYVPIPRIEFSDHQIDAVVENLVLESDNFAPNVLEIASDNYWRWGRKNVANKNKNSIDIKVAGVQLDLREVSYYVKRKQGFPSLTDTGMLNVRLAGEGLCFRMKLSTADKSDKQHFFKVDKVDVDVKNLEIKVVKSKHKLLFGLFKPLALKTLRPVIQKVAEKQIKDQFNQFDALLYAIKQEADRAKEEVRENPEEAPNVYNRYISAAQKRIMQGKKKAEEVAADKKVNMAVTREDSIFPNIKLPGGISTKATEYKELARKGEKWESPVFSIGSAPKSNDIPSAPSVVRKPHVTASPSNPTTSLNNTGGNFNSTSAIGGGLNGTQVKPGPIDDYGVPVTNNVRV
ncbi:uncharacterized protein B0I36DRAFT_261193 [Microdochium trichocladiopsis]|uniref:Bactericidal permeability-increasing protein n=1 Tax=Microdochium trichocladiopsis TaxID=1682393 RepID=A0A9P8YLW3_9PEZI|nr:uncharacterized protein B0I36DRAFT_261193 [Microdochium trichocladiopsis]KAH7041424.1 hypothetical protein B0I36DRAFT_261193 [Microdochium trichocladiopsis]